VRFYVLGPAPMLITTIVSGGQTGADRAALDVALAWGLEVGGWVPSGRLAEDGIISSRYAGLRETVSADPAERTRLNVRDCEGSLIISHGPLRGGSLLAAESAEELGRPLLHIDLVGRDMADAVMVTAEWVRTQRIRALGVGGPRASEDPRVYDATVVLLSGLLGWLLAADAATRM
jgi:hypothetical protein